MYPSGIFSDTKSPGEKEIFERLRDDPLTREWVGIHSLDVPEHRSQLYGEIDFVIIVPEKGVLCLEVKAVNSVKRSNGVWHLGNAKSESRGPFKQASEAMHSIRTHIASRDSQLAKVVFFSAVIFPYIEFSLPPTEWHPWQAIDSRKYNSCSMGEIVEEILNKGRIWLAQNPNAKWFSMKSKQPTLNEVKQIANLLRIDFEYFESPEARAKRRNTELKRYTEDNVL
jgi:hypothetical protein